ncbi:hypothetical protein LIER_23318 [Lithospermum erythrorhizon]|uniref:SBP-type domain-containing protein n=1 Tax=Lithospermum erythrorhizon TaxID=34254 RepID=A0AAV3R0P4_LITER
MEQGSSFSSSSSCSPDHSVNGLKFGQKIYFEDVGSSGGPQGKSGNDGGSSSGLPPQSPAKKGRSGAVQSGQPPRCQVEGCQVDLSDAKTYYSRHKVCGLHSKTPKVIVAGIEQRFCQQCSRFHLLLEFDQGKRSCRRRLAGHNERRRKPPTGSLTPQRYGSLSSPCLENGLGGEGFLMDFSAYPDLSGGASWSNARQPDHASINFSPGAGKSHQQTWQNNSGCPPSGLVLHGSATRTAIPSPGIPSADRFTGFSDSSRALSLLSNQPWGSGTRSSTLGVNNLLNPDGTPMVQPFGIHGAPGSHFSSPSWGFKSDEVESSCNELHSNLGLGPMSHNPPNYHNPSHLEVSQQRNSQQYLDNNHSRGYDSSHQHINWSL